MGQTKTVAFISGMTEKGRKQMVQAVIKRLKEAEEESAAAMVIDLTSFEETRGLNESDMIEYLQDI